MIYCREVARETPPVTDSLFRFCGLNSFNLYSVEKTESGKIGVKPLFDEATEIFSNPKLVCIIFESNRINSIIEDIKA